MIDETVISGLRAHDRNLNRMPPAASPDLVRSLDPALREFDEQARTLAVSYVTRWNGPGAGNLLLKLTADRSATVAAAAAQSLLKIGDTAPGEAILAAIPTRQDSFVRGQLYLAAGKAKTPPGLAAFRSAAAKETDPDAAEQAQVAAVRLGGDVERKAFFERIKTTVPDKALKVGEQMLYVGDPKLAKALGPWFGKKDGIFRLGSDRQGDQMARMCDVAAWTAYKLGVKFALQPDYLTNFDAAVIGAAKGACAALPD